MDPQTIIDEAIQQQQQRPEDRVDQEALKLAQLQKQRDLEQQHAGWLEQTITKNKLVALEVIREDAHNIAMRSAIDFKSNSDKIQAALIREQCLLYVINFLKTIN